MDTLCIGSHISTSSGLLKSIQTAYANHGARALQCFIGNPRSGVMTDSVYDKYKQTGHLIKDFVTAHDISLYIHAPYVWNLAQNPDTEDPWWIHGMIRTLKVADMIGAKGCVVHMGKSVKLPVETAKQFFVASLKAVIQQQKRMGIQAKVFVETAAGQGTELFATKDGKLDAIVELARHFVEDDWNHISFCVDTCHVFAAGYPVTGEFWNEWNDKIGVERLGVIHVNDSVGDLGCKKDRHASLKHGKIPMEGFVSFVQGAHTHGIPMVLETPLCMYDVPNLAEMILGHSVLQEDYDVWFAKQKLEAGLAAVEL